MVVRKFFCPKFLKKASESFFSEVFLPKVFRPKVFDFNVASIFSVLRAASTFETLFESI